MTSQTLSVPDISCAHRDRAIRGTLEPLAGVRSVAVDIPGQTVRVQYDEDAVTILAAALAPKGTADGRAAPGAAA